MKRQRATEFPVCVTGVSGFIGSRLVADILDATFLVFIMHLGFACLEIATGSE